MQTMAILNIMETKGEIRREITNTIISALIVNTAESIEAEGKYLKASDARMLKENLEHSFRSTTAQVKNDKIKEDDQVYTLSVREDLARLLNDIIRLDITADDINFPEESEWL